MKQAIIFTAVHFFTTFLGQQVHAAEPTYQVKLALGSVARKVVYVGSGQYRVDVTFTNGNDAGPRTIAGFYALVKSGGTVINKMDNIPLSTTCVSNACEVTGVFTTSNINIAKNAEIRIGLKSSVMVRWMNVATYDCEFEHVEDCNCSPCSTGPNVTSTGTTVSSGTQEVLDYQSTEHYHAGINWVVPTL